MAILRIGNEGGEITAGQMRAACSKGLRHYSGKRHGKVPPGNQPKSAPPYHKPGHKK